MNQVRRIRCWRLAWLCALLCPVVSSAESSLKNDRYELRLGDDNSVEIRVANLPPQIIRGEFAVMFSERDPGYSVNHENYLLAPRTAIRWANCNEDLPSLNHWLATPEMRAAIDGATEVTEDKEGKRTWTYRDAGGHVVKTVTGPYAQGTTNPMASGKRGDFRPTGAEFSGRSLRWIFSEQSGARLEAGITLPEGDADPSITWKITADRGGFYSVIFTGAPQYSIAAVKLVPQECAGAHLRQSDFVVAERDLKLPRIHFATRQFNAALVVDSKESPFRLVDLKNSRFGLMIARSDGQLRAMAIAPLMGGPESKMRAGETRSLCLRYVIRSGDWKDTYRYIARSLYGFRDMRDNRGPGSLNGTIERIVDYLVDRNGHNYAMWHDEQKYYDYWSDKSGVFKPFSPLFGLSAAIVTDDEDFYRRRALPAVEFALSRKSNVFSPYELRDNGQIKNPNRQLGAPYMSGVELVSLSDFYQGRNQAISQFARSALAAKPGFVAALARYRLSAKPEDLDDARKQADAALSRPLGSFMDWLELNDQTHDPRYLNAAVESAYGQAAELNLFPHVPDEKITVDVGGKAPIHEHSYGRNRVWGFPLPEPFPSPEQTVPAWRAALLGVDSLAYRGEFWMHRHGQLMRVASLAHDDLLRDVARWGVVGRFGNYAGDNRSKLSLVIEQPDAPEHPIWQLSYATINPGHAWEFVGEMLDFLISDAFERSEGQIDFPSESMSGNPFQVRLYGAREGHFYDEQRVRLWLPRKLLAIDNKQIDYHLH